MNGLSLPRTVVSLPALAIFLLTAMALLCAIRMGNKTLRSQLPGGNTTTSSRKSSMAPNSCSRESAAYATSWKVWNAMERKTNHELCCEVFWTLFLRSVSSLKFHCYFVNWVMVSLDFVHMGFFLFWSFVFSCTWRFALLAILAVKEDTDLQIRGEPGHPDPEIRGGEQVSKNNFFRPLGLSLV